MIKIFTNKCHLSEDIVVEEWADSFFNSYIYDLTEIEKGILWEIDKSRLIDRTTVITPYGTCALNEISTGTKIIISALRFPSIVFDVTGCGSNALNVLFNHISGSDIAVVLRHSDFRLPKGLTLLVNDKKEITSSTKYHSEIFRDLDNLICQKGEA